MATRLDSEWMKLVEQLMAEHVLIDEVLGSFRVWTRRWANGDGDRSDGTRFLEFFQRWAHDFHHAREEDVFIPALVNEVSLPRDRGPIAIILSEHAAMGELRRRMVELLADDRPEARATLDQLATAFSHQLWHHLDAENSVFFEEGEARLRKRGVFELEGRAPTTAELAAKEAAEALVRRFPPIVDPTIYRGDGCVMCPAYNTTCRGLEREWWSEAEWEELHQRLGSD